MSSAEKLTISILFNCVLATVLLALFLRVNDTEREIREIKKTIHKEAIKRNK